MSTEKLNYGVSCKDIDFGMLNARNQLVKNVINPLLDMILKAVKEDRAEFANPDQRFTVNVIVTSSRERPEDEPVESGVKKAINGAIVQ